MVGMMGMPLSTGSSVTPQPPVYDVNFTNATLDSSITFSRTTQATMIDSSGNMIYAPHNFIRNSTMQGVVPGTPGTLPTNWVIALAPGLTSTVVGSGIESGLTYVDIMVSGTTTGVGQINISFETGTGVSASVGQTYTHSVYVRMTAGSLANCAFQVDLDEYTSGTFNNNDGCIGITPTNAALATQRYSYTRTMTGTTTTAVRPILYTVITTGSTINVTLRIAAPQLEQNPYATNFISTTNSAVYGPRIDCNPSTTVTNYIRNPAGVGAVAGTPGTPPTYWAIQYGQGITSSVIGTGIESGIPYTDIRWFGTAAASVSAAVYPDWTTPYNNVPATVGQVVTFSSYLKLSGGTWNNMSGEVSMWINMWDINSNFLGSSQRIDFSVNSSLIVSQRFVITVPITFASTASVLPAIFWPINAGSTIDVTLRVGAPQLELGVSTPSQMCLPPSGTTGISTTFGTKQRTNLLYNSQTFIGGNWYLMNASVIPNMTTAPDGSLSAVKLVENTSLGSHYIDWLFTTINVTQTMSIFAKAADRSTLYLEMYDGVAPGGASVLGLYNLVTGTFTISNYANNDFANFYGSMVYYGNGWWRCILTVTKLQAGSNLTILFTLENNGQSYQGNGTSGLYIWGAQLELGAIATPYIPTTSIAATVADAKGLLIEETRTNYIRNGNALGAVPTDHVEHVTNGGFSLNPVSASQNTLQNGWTWAVISGGTTTVTYSSLNSNVVISSDGTHAGWLYTSFTTSIGASYNLMLDTTGDSCTLGIGTSLTGTSVFSIANTAVSTKQVYQFVATSSTSYLQLGNGALGSATIANVSVQAAGVLPTNWWSNATQDSGTSYQVVGSGIDSGINYADIRFYGTPGWTYGVELFFDNTFPIASVSQNWAYSVNTKLVSGSIQNSTLMSLNDYNGTALTSTVLSGSNYAVMSPSTLALSLQKVSVTRMTTSTSIVATSGNWWTQLNANTSYDFTVRFGAPQLELCSYGPYATSYIPTSGTIATRTADYANVTSIPWFNSLAGTIEAETIFETASTGTPAIYPALVQFTDGTSNNQMQLFYSGGPALQYRIAVTAAGGGVNVFDSLNYVTNVTDTAGAVAKLALSYGPKGYSSAVNGKDLTSVSLASIVNLQATQRTLPVNASWWSITWNGTVFCTVAEASNYAATSTDGINWTQRTLPTTAAWTSVIWGGSLFVAVSQNSTIAASSPDGITWTQRALPTIAGWLFLAYNGSLFVASTGYTIAGVIAASSSNGITWTQRTMPASAIWTGVAWGGSLFVAVSKNSTIAASSPDGINWTQQILPASLSWRTVAWGGSLFVAVSQNSTIAASSPDGINWTQRILPTSLGYNSVAWSGSLFVAVSGNSTIAASSPDGITWTQQILPINANWYSIVWGGSLFVGIAFTSSIGVSIVNASLPTGITTLQIANSPGATQHIRRVRYWNTENLPNTTQYSTAITTISSSVLQVNAQLQTMPSNASWASVVYGGSLFVALAGNIVASTIAASSPDGIIWTQRTLPVSANWLPVATNGSLYVVIAGNATLSSVIAASSPDGINWTQRTMPVSSTWTTVAYGGSLFVALAEYTTIAASSPDGITWTLRTLPVTAYWISVVWNGSVFCAVSNYGNTAITSPDGITWTLRTLPVGAWWTAIAWNGTVFCAVSYLYGGLVSNVAGTSPDGINWTQRTLPSNQNWIGISWNGNVFCAISQPNVMATSPDGITWTQKTLSVATNYQSVTSNGTIFVVTMPSSNNVLTISTTYNLT